MKYKFSVESENKPEDYAIVVSCDDKYFGYARSFIGSCARIGMNVHVNLVNPNPDTYQEMLDASKAFNEMNVTFSIMEWVPSAQDDDRPFLCSARFFAVEHLMEEYPIKYFPMDVDSVMLNWFQPSNVAVDDRIAYFNRDYEINLDMKVAAGVMGFDTSHEMTRHFVRSLCQNIRDDDETFFVDQRAIKKTVEDYRDKVKYKDLNTEEPKFMDWDFDVETSVMWTGKGNRKYTDERFKLAVWDASVVYEFVMNYYLKHGEYNNADQNS